MQREFEHTDGRCVCTGKVTRKDSGCSKSRKWTCEESKPTDSPTTTKTSKARTVNKQMLRKSPKVWLLSGQRNTGVTKINFCLLNFHTDYQKIYNYAYKY